MSEIVASAFDQKTLKGLELLEAREECFRSVKRGCDLLILSGHFNVRGIVNLQTNCLEMFADAQTPGDFETITQMFAEDVATLTHGS